AGLAAAPGRPGYRRALQLAADGGAGDRLRRRRGNALRPRSGRRRAAVDGQRRRRRQQLAGALGGRGLRLVHLPERLQVRALDPSSGEAVWSTNVGSAIPYPFEQGTFLGGLSGGAGILVVSTTTTLLAYGPTG